MVCCPEQAKHSSGVHQKALLQAQDMVARKTYNRAANGPKRNPLWDVVIPPVDPCPLCKGESKAYFLGTAGMVRCWGCGLRLECADGIVKAVERWNERKT